MTPSASQPALKRELGLFTCILLVIGNIIGVGIFTTPGEIANGLPSAGWVLTAWLIGGLMAMVGALTYAELGAMYPKAGGNYVFLREAYGPLWAFLYGWAYTLVTSTGTIALLAIGFGEYLGIATGTWTSKLFSISVVLVLTILNAGGVQLGARVMDAITSLKVVAMLILVLLGFVIGNGQVGHFQPLFTGDSGGALLAIGTALVPMAFTYSGWNSTVLVAEEVKNPERLIPLSLIFGTLATTAIYMLMNAVYLYAIPLERLVGEVKVAHVAAEILFGGNAAQLIKILVATSVLGCISASLLANPRTTFALGRDGLFFRFTGKVHPKYQTPSGAILFQGLWACFLILIGNFTQILRLVSVPLVIIATMTVASIFVFRFKRPDQPRPYKCWGYPIVPILYILVSIGMLYVTFQARKQVYLSFGPQVPVAYLGFLLFVVGVPVYYLWKRFYRTSGAENQ
jgi:basic amino acid/polyamine antiporter, APA family